MGARGGQRRRDLEAAGAKISNARISSARVFITKGPWRACRGRLRHAHLGASAAGGKDIRRSTGEGRGIAGIDLHQATVTADPRDGAGGNIGRAFPPRHCVNCQNPRRRQRDIQQPHRPTSIYRAGDIVKAAGDHPRPATVENRHWDIGGGDFRGAAILKLKATQTAVGDLGHLGMHDTPAGGHPLHVAGLDGAGVTDGVPHPPLKHHRHGFKAAVGMVGEAGDPRLRVIGTELVQHQKRVKQLQRGSANRPFKSDASAVGSGIAGTLVDDASRRGAFSNDSGCFHRFI